MIRILCIKKDSNGTITDLNSKTVNAGLTTQNGLLSKKAFITKYGTQSIVIDSNGNKVNVVNGEYLRSDGNQSKKDDLGDVTICK